MERDRQWSASDESTPFTTLFDRAIVERGITVKEVATRLKACGNSVSEATLSYWRSGKRHPSATSSPILESIEKILGVDDGVLVRGAERGARGPSAPSIAALTYSLPSIDRAYKDVLLQLGGERDVLAPVNMISKLEVARDWTRGRWTTTTTARVLGGGDTSRIVRLIAVPGGTEEPPRLIDASGVSLIDAYSHPDGEAFGFQLALESPAPRGELVHFSTTFDLPIVHPMFGESTSQRIRELVLVLEFHPDSIPAWVEETESEDPDADRRLMATNGRRTITVSRRRFGPGLLALHWGDEW